MASRLLSWIPNLISLGRLLLVPVAVYVLIEGHYITGFWVFFVAALSDAVDGYVAKQWNVTSRVGAYLDPIADKALLVSIYLTLSQLGQIDLWLVILIVFRDVLIVGGAILYHTLTHSLTMEPLLVSKLNTVAQISLACAILVDLAYGWQFHLGREGLIAMVTVTTFLSGAQYVLIWGARAVALEQDQ